VSVGGDFTGSKLGMQIDKLASIGSESISSSCGKFSIEHELVNGECGAEKAKVLVDVGMNRPHEHVLEKGKKDVSPAKKH